MASDPDAPENLLSFWETKLEAITSMAGIMMHRATFLIPDDKVITLFHALCKARDATDVTKGFLLAGDMYFIVEKTDAELRGLLT